MRRGLSKRFEELLQITKGKKPKDMDVMMGQGQVVFRRGGPKG